MYNRVEQTYYLFSAIALLGVMFVFAPASTKEMANFQTEILNQTEMAINQVLGDINVVEPLQMVYLAVSDFYNASSEETLAMIPSVEVPEYVNVAFQKATVATTKFFAKGLENVLPAPELAIVPSSEVALAPLYNIVPPFTETNIEAYNVQAPELAVTTEVFSTQELVDIEEISQAQVQGFVAGTYVDLEQPVNDMSRPWVTLQDNMTGQTYCVAIYNNEVNKYLGECKRDYY